MSSRRIARVRWAALFASTVALTSCSSPAPDGGPAADVGTPVTGGNGVFLGAGAELPSGYVEEEFFAEGMAVDYAPAGYLPDDGRWTLVTGSPAPYRTRVLVRRPADAARASGVVLVEWLNVSGGVDADADYRSLVEEIVRRGHVWVGVSAQHVGVEGGSILVGTGDPNDVAGQGLVRIDPARYGSLEHPGDGYSFDIYTQVARALRRDGVPLGGIRAEVLLAVGESQSAMALTSYYDGVQPETRAFDGFFLHSRGSFPLPFVPPGEAASLITAITGSERPLLRTDVEAPAFVLQAEGDTVPLLGSSLVRQPDGATHRLWEVAGTAHADRHLLGSFADTVDCNVPINDGPMHVVAKAGLRALERWVREGVLPPVAPRLDITGIDAGSPVIQRDADGIALGGVRTPPVDVPLDVLTGIPGSASVFCSLLGSTTPLDPARIDALYASRADYEAAYAASVDATLAAGFALAEDRAALEAYADPARVAP